MSSQSVSTQNQVAPIQNVYNASTFAGDGSSSILSIPNAVVADKNGNIYVTSPGTNNIVKITSAGIATIFAGSGTVGAADGNGALAQFHAPTGIAVDSLGNIFVADKLNNRIRKIAPNGDVTTFAGSSVGSSDGVGTAAQFNGPYSVAIDSSDNVYVTDTNNNRIRKITPTGVVTTVAGSGVAGAVNGLGTTAQFNLPFGITVDSSGNIYVSDTWNHLIRKITPNGTVTTLAGSVAGFSDGAGTSAMFNAPGGITVDALGNVYVADISNQRIRKITASGVVTTIAGTGSLGFSDNVPALQAMFNQPFGVSSDSAGNLYVADTSNARIRKLTLNANSPVIGTQPVVSTLAAGTQPVVNTLATVIGTQPIVNTLATGTQPVVNTLAIGTTQVIGTVSAGTQSVTTATAGTQQVGNISTATTQTIGTVSVNTQAINTAAIGTQPVGTLAVRVTQPTGTVAFGANTSATEAQRSEAAVVSNAQPTTTLNLNAGTQISTSTAVTQPVPSSTTQPAPSSTTQLVSSSTTQSAVTTQAASAQLVNDLASNTQLINALASNPQLISALNANAQSINAPAAKSQVLGGGTQITTSTATLQSTSLPAMAQSVNTSNVSVQLTSASGVTTETVATTPVTTSSTTPATETTVTKLMATSVTTPVTTPATETTVTKPVATSVTTPVTTPATETTVTKPMATSVTTSVTTSATETVGTVPVATTSATATVTAKMTPCVCSKRCDC